MRRLNENIRLVSSMAQMAATAPQTPGPVPAQAAPARPFQRRYSPRHTYGALDLGTNNCRILVRSEEHTSELQSLMRISYAVFLLKQKTHTHVTSYETTNSRKLRQPI